MAMQTLWDNPKFKKLARKLKCQEATIYGHLDRFWQRAHSVANPIFDPDDIEVIVDWIGEDGALVSAMLELGWLDQLPDGKVEIHDYWENCPQHVWDMYSKRIKRSERGKTMQKSRDNQEAPRPKGGVNRLDAAENGGDLSAAADTYTPRRGHGIQQPAVACDNPPCPTERRGEESIESREEKRTTGTTDSVPSPQPTAPTSPPAPGLSSSSSPILDLQNSWNNLAHEYNLPEAFTMTGLASRKKSAAARFADPDWVARYPEALDRIKTSPFLQGDSDTGWKPDIDWFLRPDTVPKILEGKYDSFKPKEIPYAERPGVAMGAPQF